MDWLHKNYDRLLLIVGALILLLSGVFIARNASNFASRFNDLPARAGQQQAAPPGMATKVEAAARRLRQPPQWTFSGRSGLFVPEKHFIDADGQPATLQTTEVHPPVPNEWFEQFSLPIADGDVLDQDPDGDGFNNLEEWQGHTNPVDRNSHPDYVTKLQLKSYHEEPFRLVFASRIEDTFGINTIDLAEPTQFLKVGDRIVGTSFRIANFKEKYAKDKYGTTIDVSELTLENITTQETLVLIKERVATSPESVATFAYTWRERREFSVKKDQQFSLPPQTDLRYKLIDVQPTKATIVSSEAPDVPIEIGGP